MIFDITDKTEYYGKTALSRAGHYGFQTTVTYWPISFPIAVGPALNQDSYYYFDTPSNNGVAQIAPPPQIIYMGYLDFTLNIPSIATTGIVTLSLGRYELLNGAQTFIERVLYTTNAVQPYVFLPGNGQIFQFNYLHVSLSGTALTSIVSGACQFTGIKFAVTQ